jgi:hypothetical protein
MAERVPNYVSDDYEAWGCIGGFVDTWKQPAPKKRGRPALEKRGSPAPKKRGRPPGSTSAKRQKVEDRYDTEAPFEVMFPGKTVRLVNWCLFEGESFDEARRKAILPEGGTHFARIRMRRRGDMHCIEAAAVCVS